jgi:Uma2 family endonuclease
VGECHKPPPAEADKDEIAANLIAMNETEIADPSPLGAFLPATIIPDSPLRDHELELASVAALDLERIRCERNEQGKLRLYAPTTDTIWLMIQMLDREIRGWMRGTKRTFGDAFVRRRFFLDNQIVMCPDIGYIAPAERRKPPVIPLAGAPLNCCPNFVAEFCAHPKELRMLKDKMLRWLASGTELGWLIVLQEQCVYVYAPGNEPLIMDGDAIGQGPLGGFEFDLSSLWSIDELRRSY